MNYPMFFSKNLSRFRHFNLKFQHKLCNKTKHLQVWWSLLNNMCFLAKKQLPNVKLPALLEKSIENEEINDKTMQPFAVSNPHFKKKAKGGEDSHYVTDDIIAIADGVGGWSELGIDPAKYSRTLCENIKLNSQNIGKINKDSCRLLLVKSAQETNVMGSSTCLVALFDKETNTLFTSYIGDSAYLILKFNGLCYDLSFKSEEQQHEFNMPYQIGTKGDDPENALCNEHRMNEGDIVIAATDGLWDNLETENIVDIVNSLYFKNQGDLTEKKIAEALSNKAEKFSTAKNYRSPFAKKAKEHGKDYIGGKPDDITVVVSKITSLKKQ